MARGGSFTMRVTLNRIDAYHDVGVEQANAAARAACELGARVAQAKAPKLTGALRSSVRADDRRIVAEAPYSVYQELGTKRFRGHGFVKAGVDAAADAWSGLLARRM